MPYRCSVPNCKGNYSKAKKVAVFSFPKDPELGQKWIEAIRRDKFKPTTSSKVCELHFEDDLIERTTAYQTLTGEILKVRLKIPRLIKGAIPNKSLPSCFDVVYIKVENSTDEEESSGSEPEAKRVKTEVKSECV